MSFERSDRVGNTVVQRLRQGGETEEATGHGAASLPLGYLQHYGMAPTQRKAGGDGAVEAIEASSGSGQAMPGDVQAKMEHSLGADFSGVRIHESNAPSAVGALAFTQGSDIHFSPGLYAPHSQKGQELLGHELTHVVQQSEGRVAATTQHKGVAINDDHSLEAEADVMGAAAARGEVARPAAQRKAAEHRDAISRFQSENPGSSIREGQGRVLGPVQNKRDSSGVLQCWGGGGGGGGGGFPPATGKKTTNLEGTFGKFVVNHGLTTLPTSSASGEYEITIDMTPNEKTKGSNTIRFLQTVRRGTTPGNWSTKATDSGMTADRAKRVGDDGWRVDRADPSRDKSPFYGHVLDKGGGHVPSPSLNNARGGKFGGPTVYLYDAPAVIDPSVLEFASNAMDESTGASYGIVAWGFQYNSSAKDWHEETPSLLSNGDARVKGSESGIKKWNEVYGASGTIDKNVAQVPGH